MPFGHVKHDVAVLPEHVAHVAAHAAHSPELLNWFIDAHVSEHDLSRRKSLPDGHEEHEVVVPSEHVAHEPSHAVHKRPEFAY